MREKVGNSHTRVRDVSNEIGVGKLAHHGRFRNSTVLADISGRLIRSTCERELLIATVSYLGYLKALDQIRPPKCGAFCQLWGSMRDSVLSPDI